MLQALKVGLIIERTNKKNLVALLAVVVVVIGCMLFIKAQSIGEAIIEKKGDYYHAQAILSKFQIKDASEEGNGSDLYKNYRAADAHKRYDTSSFAACRS